MLAWCHWIVLLTAARWQGGPSLHAAYHAGCLQSNCLAADGCDWSMIWHTASFYKNYVMNGHRLRFYGQREGIDLKLVVGGVFFVLPPDAYSTESSWPRRFSVYFVFHFRRSCGPWQPCKLLGCNRRWYGSSNGILGQFPKDLELGVKSHPQPWMLFSLHHSRHVMNDIVIHICPGTTDLLALLASRGGGIGYQH